MLAIGDFSRLTHLSVRTLRRYHDAGLLEPATVDDATGYRYYSADQIPTAQVIHRLRELDVPLPDVQRILRSPDPRARAGLVADHLRRLEADLDRTRAAVASLRRPARHGRPVGLADRHRLAGFPRVHEVSSPAVPDPRRPTRRWRSGDGFEPCAYVAYRPSGTS
jgi:DNA-binding transcriptional MerR regulator